MSCTPSLISRQQTVCVQEFFVRKESASPRLAGLPCVHLRQVIQSPRTLVPFYPTPQCNDRASIRSAPIAISACMLELGDDCVALVIQNLNFRDVASVSLCSKRLCSLARRHSGPTGAAIDAVSLLTSSSSRSKRRAASAKMKKLVHISSGTALFASEIIMHDLGHMPQCMSLLDARKGGALFYALITAVIAKHYGNTIKALSLQSKINSASVTRNMPVRLRKVLANCVVLSNDACIASLFANQIRVTDEDVSLAIKSGRHHALSILDPVFMMQGSSSKRVLPLSLSIPTSLRQFVSYRPR